MMRVSTSPGFLLDMRPSSEVASRAAPLATAVSVSSLIIRLTPEAFRASLIAGRRVEPPTRITSERSLQVIDRSLRSCSHIWTVESTRPEDLNSKSSLVTTATMLFPENLSGTRMGELNDSIFLIFSASTENFVTNSSSLWRSIENSSMNWSARISLTTSSQSFPPRLGSPRVPTTSMDPSVMRRMVMSKVPPPRSYVIMVLFLEFFIP